MAKKFAFETKDLGESGEGFDLINIAGQSLKYLVPAAKLFQNEKQLKQLRKDSKVKFEPVSLLHGAVRDIPKPNFAQPSTKEYSGSSLNEFLGGQLFKNAQQKSAEREYSIQNSLSKIQQEEAIRGSQNQERGINNELVNREKAINAQNANYEKLLRMGQQDELLLGLTETAQNDLTQRNYLNASQKASAAADILRFGDPKSEIYQKALKYYQGNLEKEKGGKIRLKTKFSNAS